MAQPSTVQQMAQATQKYLVRHGGGRSLQMDKFKSKDALPPAERLMGSLILANKAEVSQILSLPPENWMADFLRILTRDGLIVLVFDRFKSMELDSRLGEISLGDLNFLTELKNRLVRIILHSQRHEDHFQVLLKVLEPLADSILFEKGVVLSRTVYENQAYRISGDFDVIVEESQAFALFELLRGAGFHAEMDHPGHCHQKGSGPSRCIEDMFLTPTPSLTICVGVVFEKDGWPYVETKLDPMERGPRMKRLQEVHRDAVVYEWQGKRFRAPSPTDHLILELTHFHKHSFDGWHWLLDIHLLSQSLSAAQWDEFCRNAELEGVSASCWAGLVLASDRLDTNVPDHVLTRLKPADNVFSHLFTYTINTQFDWNSCGILMLLLNAAFAGDGRRKLKLLKAAFFPDSQFLSNYYGNGNALGPLRHFWYWLLNTLVVIFPAGLIRHTIGRFIWTSP